MKSKKCIEAAKKVAKILVQLAEEEMDRRERIVLSNDGIASLFDILGEDNDLNEEDIDVPDFMKTESWQGLFLFILFASETGPYMKERLERMRGHGRNVY